MLVPPGDAGLVSFDAAMARSARGYDSSACGGRSRSPSIDDRARIVDAALRGPDPLARMPYVRGTAEDRRDAFQARSFWTAAGQADPGGTSAANGGLGAGASLGSGC